MSRSAMSCPRLPAPDLILVIQQRLNFDGPDPVPVMGGGQHRRGKTVSKGVRVLLFGSNPSVRRDSSLRGQALGVALVQAFAARATGGR